MAKRLTIKTLLDVGHRQREVAELTSVLERSVRRVDREPVPLTLDDAAGRAARRVGRPSKVSGVRDKVTALLAAEPTLPSTEIYRRMKLDGYIGQKSALFALLAEARPVSPARPLVRFEGLPGEFC